MPGVSDLPARTATLKLQNQPLTFRILRSPTEFVSSFLQSAAISSGQF